MGLFDPQFSTANTSTSSTIPSWLRNAYQSNIRSAQREAGSAYSAYDPADRVADLSGIQQLALGAAQDYSGAGVAPTEQAISSLQGIQGMTDPYYNTALNAMQSGLGLAQSGVPYLGQAGQTVGDATSVTGGGLAGIMAGQNTISSALPFAGQSSAMVNAGINTPGFGGARGLTYQSAVSPDLAGIQQFMDPFTQSVIDPTLREIDEDREQRLNQLGAQAGRVGAFGGSRQAILESESNRQFDELASDTFARLMSQNYGQALNQYNTQQQLQQAAGGQLANIAGAQGGLTMQGAGITADLLSRLAEAGQAQGGLGTAQSQVGTALGRLGATQADIAQGYGTLGGQLGGIGSRIGDVTTDLGRLGIAAAGATGELGGQLSNLAGADLERLMTAGALQRAPDQALADAMYTEFLRRDQYPRDQANFMSGILTGIPTQSVTTTRGTQQTPGPSLGSQLLGAGMGITGLLADTGAFGADGWGGDVGGWIGDAASWVGNLF